ncbi:MAG: DUF58 domain-containing protein [Gammaproteobacteria bacterium]|nr:DUF58 domain-containing protein [Gammaproteobacteria bacterium]
MLKALKSNFNIWLDRRIPAANSITLHHRQTFILPSRFGYMMLLILILMLIAATNYQNSLAFLLTFTLGSLGFNVIIQTYRNLTGINIKARSGDAIFAGQSLDIPLIVTSTEKRDYYSIGFGTRKEVQQIVDIPMGKSVDTSIKVLPENRGWYSPGRLYTVTAYPFGLLRVWSWFQFTQQYLVYPAPIDPGVVDLSGSGELENEQGTIAIGNEDFFGIRSYRNGDPKRQIHWRAYAREQGLHTMEFVEPEGKSSFLDFDNFEGFDTEVRLSWLCFLVLQTESMGDRYGLKVPGTLIEPDHGSKHCQRCLQTLALFDEAKQ